MCINKTKQHSSFQTPSCHCVRLAHSLTMHHNCKKNSLFEASMAMQWPKKGTYSHFLPNNMYNILLFLFILSFCFIHQARRSIWYYMDVERELALAIIENRIDRLGDGSFVVCTSAKDFATVCMVVKSHLFNVPVEASAKGVCLKLVGVRAPACQLLYAALALLLDLTLHLLDLTLHLHGAVQVQVHLSY